MPIEPLALAIGALVCAAVSYFADSAMGFVIAIVIAAMAHEEFSADRAAGDGGEG